jgi:hypothetical protein
VPDFRGCDGGLLIRETAILLGREQPASIPLAVAEGIIDTSGVVHADEQPRGQATAVSAMCGRRIARLSLSRYEKFSQPCFTSHGFVRHLNLSADAVASAR